jgi:hypothetical protein
MSVYFIKIESLKPRLCPLQTIGRLQAPAIAAQRLDLHMASVRGRCEKILRRCARGPRLLGKRIGSDDSIARAIARNGDVHVVGAILHFAHGDCRNQRCFHCLLFRIPQFANAA